MKGIRPNYESTSSRLRRYYLDWKADSDSVPYSPPTTKPQPFLVGDFLLPVYSVLARLLALFSRALFVSFQHFPLVNNFSVFSICHESVPDITSSNGACFNSLGCGCTLLSDNARKTFGISLEFPFTTGNLIWMLISG
jgi:hypothetical protein